MSAFKIGHGYDVHRLVSGRKLVLGGVDIPHEFGLLGHSDADVLLHAVCDSVLGALGEGDIGRHFPDTDEKYKDISSEIIAADCYRIMENKGYVIGNIDVTVIAQKPKLSPYMEQMRQNVARIFHTEWENVNIKATTEEKLGFTGRQEGISCHSVVLIEKHSS